MNNDRLIAGFIIFTLASGFVWGGDVVESVKLIKRGEFEWNYDRDYVWKHWWFGGGIMDLSEAVVGLKGHIGEMEDMDVTDCVDWVWKYKTLYVLWDRILMMKGLLWDVYEEQKRRFGEMSVFQRFYNRVEIQKFEDHDPHSWGWNGIGQAYITENKSEVYAVLMDLVGECKDAVVSAGLPIRSGMSGQEFKLDKKQVK